MVTGLSQETNEFRGEVVTNGNGKLTVKDVVNSEKLNGNKSTKPLYKELCSSGNVELFIPGPLHVGARWPRARAFSNPRTFVLNSTLYFIPSTSSEIARA